jgi:DNA modification methylase/predicted RNA-binding Zn-ribbon protein involved in translation (DUF1610 family)
MSEKVEQASLFEEETTKGPVTCLGLTFKNDEERREYFREELRKKLPELKKIEGFPIGEDEDIIALSDPPYFTACPNPWIGEIIKDWKKRIVNNDLDEEYDKKPFTSDVSEGKNDVFYNAHSYHTKVPFKAILRYILHYTNPGDIVFDGFSGTGMTGVAAKLAGDRDTLKEMGYIVDDNDNVFLGRNKISKLGKRNVILNDLSPSASVISYNYCYNYQKKELVKEAEKYIDILKKEFSWMFRTQHLIDGKVQKDNQGKIIYGFINNVVWSDVFLCPNCSEEIIYWDETVNYEKKQMKREFNCPKCKIELSKSKVERSYELKYDQYIKKSVRIAKQKPVLISYSVGTKNFDKEPDSSDYDLLTKIEDFKIETWFPTFELPNGYNTKQPITSHGLTHTHHFYSKRNLIVMSRLFELLKKSRYFNKLIFFFQASINRATKTNRFRFGGTGGLSGTLYVPSLNVERNVISLLESKLKDFIKILNNNEIVYNSAISNQSTTGIFTIPENSVDYIFTDPPFGSNIMYSELNFLWESWFNILTNKKEESIINNVQEKGLPEYKDLMTKAFENYYRILKPGRWLTVEFSNSQSSVWNTIREAIEKSGFIIANVSALDKKQGSFKAVTSTTAVKQDLVISAYKPKQENIEKMIREQNTEESAWTFVRQHLEQLPTFFGVKGEVQVLAERTPRILFDRMVAYHVQRGLPVPISSADFQIGIAQRFPMRDGMAFLEDQVAEYDKKRILVKEFSQLNLFVSDENSAIEWIRQQLMNKPQTRQDLHPNFMREIQHIAKHELLPELDDLLEQNFLMYDGKEEVPSQIHGYLSSNYKDLRNLEKSDPRLKEKGKNRWYVPDPNKQADLEKLREKSLLREFESYKAELEGNKKKLKQFRTEAIRIGFKKAWSEKDFETIVKVGERLPEKVIQEDDKLLMYFDQAQIRMGM